MRGISPALPCRIRERKKRKFYEDIRLYIEAAQDEAPDDAAFMAKVLGDVARARNISELARETGIARETLYKVTRGEGNPTLDTISKLAHALGFRLTLQPLPTSRS